MWLSMENQLISILKKKAKKKKKKKLEKLQFVFLHLVTIWGLRAFKKNIRKFADDDIWLAAKNLMNQNPKQFKESFPSKKCLKYIFIN